MATWTTHERLETCLTGAPDRPVTMSSMLAFEQRADASHAGIHRSAGLQSQRLFTMTEVPD